MKIFFMGFSIIKYNNPACGICQNTALKHEFVCLPPLHKQGKKTSQLMLYGLQVLIYYSNEVVNEYIELEMAW